MDAISRPGCPLCRLAAEASERWLETLFREQVNDVSVRQYLRRCGTFCPQHTAQALRAADPLGASIIFGDLLRRAIDATPDRWDTTCPLCAHEAAVVHRAGGTLLEHIDEDDVREACVASDGLCLPHLRRTLDQARPPRCDLLAGIEREKLTVLAAQCEGFVRKSDYRHQDELTEAEGRAWRRAARKLGGGCPDDAP